MSTTTIPVYEGRRRRRDLGATVEVCGTLELRTSGFTPENLVKITVLMNGKGDPVVDIVYFVVPSGATVTRLKVVNGEAGTRIYSLRVKGSKLTIPVATLTLDTSRVQYEPRCRGYIHIMW